MWRFGLIFFLTLALVYSEEVDSSEDGVKEGAVKTSCACGWVNRSPQRIIGGKKASRNEWPMQAAIIRKEFLWLQNFVTCGATIISRRHLLTAAHCLRNELGKPYELKEIGVLLGAHNLKDIDYNDPNVMITPERLIGHPEFRYPETQFDVGIIIMPAIEFSQKIGPACLPTEPFQRENQKLKTLGWGIIDAEGPTSDILKKATLMSNNGEPCKKQFSSFEEANEICTIQPDTSQCQGDSGGPLLWVDPATNRYSVVGINSYGHYMCKSFPAVSKDVYSFLPWIQKVISENYSGEKPCTKLS